MDTEQFARFAQSYGGDLRRWPLGHQAAAARLAGGGEAVAALAQATELDLLLDASPRLEASPALRQRILQTAPPEQRPHLLAEWLWRLGVGAGLASATAAGLVVGVGLSATAAEPAAMAVSTLFSPVEATSFGPAWEVAEAQEG